MQMPNLEGSGFGTTPMVVLEDKYQLMLEERIPLFELHRNRPSKLDAQDLGYLNVRVNDSYNGLTSRVIRSVRWFSGKNSYIAYSYNKRRNTSIAFCPDDINDRHEYHHWYNRIMLASTIHSGKFRIVRYHTVDGVISEGRITEEILYLSRLLHDWKAKILVRDGEDLRATGEVFRSRDRDEVIDFIRKTRSEGREVSEPVFSKIKEIEDIIKLKRSEWIFSPEFQQGILPGIKSEIEKRFKPKKVTSDFKSQMVEAFSGMSAEEKASMFEQVFGAKLVQPAVQEKPSSPEGKSLSETSEKELFRIASGLRIDVIGKTREEVENEIEQRNSPKSNDIESVVGPETEEEVKIREDAAAKEKEEAKANTFREAVDL